KKFPNGATCCVVVIERGDWTFVVEVSLSQGKSSLWLISPLGNPIANPAQLPVLPLLKMLRENDRIGPTHFSLRESDGRFCLNLSVDLQGMTTARFRSTLDAFLSVIQKTQPLWDNAS